MNLNDLQAFVRVVALGTISAAALEAGVGKSTISRAIARLEDELGTELIRRSARSFTITDVGQVVYARATAPLRALSDLEIDLSDATETPRGRLVISTPHDLGRLELFTGAISEYRHLYPQVEVEIRMTDRLMKLVEEGVDVAVRAHRGAIPAEAGLMTRAIPVPSMALFAAPAYLDTQGSPEVPEDLHNHTLLLHAAMASQGLELSNGRRSIELPDLKPEVIANDFSLLQRLAVKGVGITLLMIEAVEEGEMGGLRRVLGEWESIHGGAKLSLLWPESRNLAPRVRRFIELISEAGSR